MKPMKDWKAGDTEPAVFALLVFALLLIAVCFIAPQFQSPPHPERSIYSKPQ